MSMPDTLEQLLAAGRVQDATRLATQLAQSAPDSAAARPAAEAIARAYQAFHASAVHQIHDNLGTALSDDQFRALFSLVEPEIEATLEWNRRLDEIANERKMNSLIDLVKAKDMAAAEQAAATMITGMATAQLRAARARQIANALGGLIHEKERAQGLIKALSRNAIKFGIDPVSATDAEEEFARASVAATRKELQGTSTLKAQLTEAIVELGRTLPTRNALHEPTPEDLERFSRAMRAIFRCALLSARYDKFNEATLLMVEFSPKEVSAAGALAGVEQRYYAGMGRTSRMVSAKVLAEIGQSGIAFSAYQQFTRENLQSRTGKYAVESLGLLANPSAVPFLIEVVGDKKGEARTEAIFALGTIGSPPALSALMQFFSQQIRGKVVDGQPRRDAFVTISALGRAVRNASDPKFRSQTIAQLVKLLPKDDLEFAVRAALNFFTGKQDGMEPVLLAWAAQVGVTGLWSADRPELARAGRAQALGFRQPLVELLKRLAPHVMPAINDAILKYAKVYNGAYLAAGEFFAQQPHPSQVSVIRQLLLNASLHDDTKRSEYLKDEVFDAATETMEALTKDKVVASLVHALDKIGTPEAQSLMDNVFAQIQSGQLPNPGAETADILMRAHMRSQQAAGRATMAPGTSQELAEDIAPTPVTEQDLANIADLEASYLLAAKKRARKVAAMASLAQRRIAPAIPIIIRHLADSDNVIASSATVALQDIGSPPVAAQTFDHLCRELTQALESPDPAIKVKVVEAIRKLQPQRSPMKERLQKLAAKHGVDKPMRAIIASLLGAQLPAAAAQSRIVAPAEEEDLGAAARFMPTAGAAKAGDPTAISDLDKKRAYMQARREWIQGGKKGPEPQLPS